MCYVHQFTKITTFGERKDLLAVDHLSLIYLCSLIVAKPVLNGRISTILVKDLGLGLHITFLAVLDYHVEPFDLKIFGFDQLF